MDQSDTTARDTDTPLSRLLSEVETITPRFHGTQCEQSDRIDGEEINRMPNEQVKDLFRILVTASTKIQTCDIVQTGTNDPDREKKKRDTNAVAF
jgi:hypothetical protein